MEKNKIFLVVLFILFSQWNFAQETVKNIDSLLILVAQSKEDTSKVSLYKKIGSHYNVTHLDSAKVFLQKGVALAKKLDDKKGLWNNLSTLGNYYERKTSYDTAMVHYTRALDIIEETYDTKGFAVVLNNIAMVAIRKGNYDSAIQNLFKALKAEEQLGNENGIAQAYNNIGVCYYYMQNFDKTTEYLTKGLEIQQKLGNYDGLINGYNNVGAIYNYQKKYEEAIISYEKGLEISKKIGDKKLEAIQLNNIALAYTRLKKMNKAREYFETSLSIREVIEDYSGMSKTLIAFGEFWLEKRDEVNAEKYITRGLDIAKKHNLRLQMAEGYTNLGKVEALKGDYDLFEEYILLGTAHRDTLINEQNSKAILEIEAKYDTEKKENEILKQRAQLAEKELEVKRKNNLIYGSLGLALILGLLGYLFYNQQKLKNRQLKKEAQLKEALVKIETQNKLQEQRLRISRDLHDNIGAQLTFIISSIDNLKYGLKDATQKTKEKLSSISEFTSHTIYELRDTIWAMNKEDITFEDLQVRISNFIEKAKVASEGVHFSFDIDKDINPEHSFTSVVGMNIYRIIQEAVNNALKYAEATAISVKITQESDRFNIQVADNGKGYDMASVEKGNGLNTMEKRAKDINGSVVYTSEVGKGTQVQLHF